eukprot:543527_1
MNLFGKKKASGVSSSPASVGSDPTGTIFRLRGQMEALDKRESYLHKRVKTQLLEAKKLVASKDKKRAMMSLKRKKMYETEINKITGARMTLESQVLALEGSKINLSTFEAMRQGARAMKGARGNIDVDHVDEVMDDIQEEVDIADQIGEAISRPAEDLFDDDELLEELEEMEAAGLEEQLLQAPPMKVKPVESQKVQATESQLPELPDVPSTIPAVAVEEDEDAKALRELEASMAV